MSELCPVCRGEKRICLPLHHPVRVMPPNEMPTVEENSRYYDCPECVPKAPYTRMGMTKVMSWMDDSASETTKVWWRDNAAKLMRRMIAEKLIADGFIQFERLEPDAVHGEGIRATIRAVLPRHVATFEERIAERQMEIADEVAGEAKSLIANWGSFYNWEAISKATAYREIDAAVTTVRDRRGKR